MTILGTVGAYIVVKSACPIPNGIKGRMYIHPPTWPSSVISDSDRKYIWTARTSPIDAKFNNSKYALPI